MAYFHAAHDPERAGKAIDRAEFIDKGPLWRALESDRAVVLVDEIDKAPRDFPNDLLHVLDQHEFDVPELHVQVARKRGAPPPFLVITSNSERRLPEPFLRRCVFHHIEFTEEIVRRAVEARVGDFPRLREGARRLAIERFLELRAKPLRKKPATAELLVWLTILSAGRDRRGDLAGSAAAGAAGAVNADQGPRRPRVALTTRCRHAGPCTVRA